MARRVSAQHAVGQEELGIVRQEVPPRRHPVRQVPMAPPALSGWEGHDELNGLSTLADVAAWAGTDGEVDEELMKALGKPTKLRDIAFINRAVWDRTVGALDLVDQPATDTTPATRRGLTPTEESRVEIFRRVCLLRLGIQPDQPGASGLPALSVVPSGPGRATPPTTAMQTASPTRKLKLSSVVDPTLDAEISHIEAAELENLYADYRAKYGAHPSQDVDPTADQLSGLQQLLKARALPLHMGCAMLLLQAIDPERIEAYMEHIKELHNRFGTECWGLIYKADVRMRSEQMERVKRDLEAAPQHGYSSANPWSAVFFAATKDMEKSGSAKKKKKYKGDDLSVWDAADKIYTKNRKGFEICRNYNTGKSRDGDLASYLVRGGWIVVAIDLRAEHPCDVSMMKDIKNGEYDALGVATPCETFSPLREHPPGPRVLRTKEFPLGLLDKKFGLTKEEVNQVKQANSLIGISQEAIEGMLDLSRPFWWENPGHGDDKVHMWSTPMAQTILDKDHVYTAALDQCVFGAETTKPTIFAFGHLNLSGIAI
eukprot:symbB.v1.2.010766.t2/scaffold709.1/size267679/9